MSERGVYAVDRGIWDHPLFADEPFTEREAWLWLVGACAWEPKRIRVGKAVVELGRGQCAFSLRFMATKWKWSEPRVRRFLFRLKTDAMVLVEATQQTTQITICNYDKYAFGRRTDANEIDAPTDAVPTQYRRKEEELKEPKKEEQKKDSRAVASATRTCIETEFDEFWKAYPRRLGANPRKHALKKYSALVKSGVLPETLLSAARKYCVEAREQKIFGSAFVAQAVTWLNQQRFDDYRPPPGNAVIQPPSGAPTDEELRKKYGQSNPAVLAETKAGDGDGTRADHGSELRREGIEIRPSLRAL